VQLADSVARAVLILVNESLVLPIYWTGKCYEIYWCSKPKNRGAVEEKVILMNEEEIRNRKIACGTQNTHTMAMLMLELAVDILTDMVRDREKEEANGVDEDGNLIRYKMTAGKDQEPETTPGNLPICDMCEIKTEFFDMISPQLSKEDTTKLNALYEEEDEKDQSQEPEKPPKDMTEAMEQWAKANSFMAKKPETEHSEQEGGE
jgi:hypothetical protein